MVIPVEECSMPQSPPASDPVPLALLLRVKREFIEMPGLRLTAAQARRLWALDAPVCVELLDELIEEGFLVRTADGAFARLERSSHTRRTAA
jgi:hypothetical protein